MKRALNTYSLRNEWNFIIGSQQEKIEKVARLCADMDIQELELLDHHFERDNLGRDVKLFADHGVNVFAIGPHVHLLVKEEDEPAEIEEGKAWLRAASEAGVRFVRFQVGDGPLPRAYAPFPDFDEEEWEEYNESISRAVKLSLHVIEPLVEAAESLDAVIAIETHHSYSSNWAYMKQLNEAVSSRHLCWIFDIGNFENDDMRWKALDVIKERTAYVHAKAYDFDEAGLEITLDFPKACKILAGAGFDGCWSIEFEGKMNGVLGAMRTNELLKHSIAKVLGKSHEIQLAVPDIDDLMEEYFS